ncbi:hypothetical protein AAJ76_273000651 [Vairimorpha ceranae]|uniref:Uncharacterized protein n=1 Tax=Vairimorpha ceranae TaxID=40302 RepID=A0A0F9YLT4_9MICR|nr:hypothetical protein AAJ76_273000651 [Vairimorpha ceranae]KKO73722.1 hypothetical protein AAJ76_273000651 [Vairimorpha ceranae]
MRPTIKSQEGYDTIVNILKGEDSTADGSKHTKYRLKRMAELLISIDNLLYLKDT